MLFSTFARLFGFQTTGSTDEAPEKIASARSTVRIRSRRTTSTAATVGDNDSYMDINFNDEWPEINFPLDISGDNPNTLPPAPVDAINTKATVESHASGNEPESVENDQFGNSHSPFSSRFAEGSSSLSTRMPTFSRKHNKGNFFTDDYALWDEVLNGLFMGYIEDTTNNAEEVGTELLGDEESDMREDNEAKKYKHETNDEAMANAVAMGVKVRDFAAQPPHEGRFNVPVSSLIFKHCPIPEVFPAHEKALQFQYIRYLLEHDVFDLPRFDFTCTDVDRLVTCKFVRLSHFDSFLLRGMLGIGLYKRMYDRNPLDVVRELPPRARWTIPKDSHPPTDREIREYIVAQENERYARQTTVKLYLLPASERPELTEEYKLFRQHVYGIFGLSAFTEVDGLSVNEGIPDEELSFIVLTAKDKSYISPRRYSAGDWKYRAREQEEEYFEGYSTPETPGESIPRRPPVWPPSYQAGSVPSQSNQPGLSEPGSSERGRRETSDGKKRARSSSPEEDADGPSRRTRARLSEENEVGISGPNLGALFSIGNVGGPSNETAGQSSAARGTKRGRDDEDDELVQESAPSKKLKLLDGGIAIFSEAISVIGSFSTSAMDLIQANLSTAGTFISSVAAQSAALLSPEPGGGDIPAPESDSPREEIDDIWRPHPRAPAPLQRQNAFYYKNGVAMPPLSGRYELPTSLM